MRMKKIQVELMVPEYVEMPDISSMIQYGVKDYVFSKFTDNRRESHVKLKPSLVVSTHKQEEQLTMIFTEDKIISAVENE